MREGVSDSFIKETNTLVKREKDKYGIDNKKIGKGLVIYSLRSLIPLRYHDVVTASRYLSQNGYGDTRRYRHASGMDGLPKATVPSTMNSPRHKEWGGVGGGTVSIGSLRDNKTNRY